MSSKGSLKGLQVLAVAALIGCAFAGTASAQSYLNGRFTLPYDVRWQGVILSAGEYSITMVNCQSPALVRPMEGPGAAFVLARITEQATKGQPAGLLVTKRGNERLVRSFNWPERGLTFVYAPLTRGERTALAKADEAETVPIRMAAK